MIGESEAAGGAAAGVDTGVAGAEVDDDDDGGDGDDGDDVDSANG